MSNYLFMFKADESLIDVPRWLNGPDEERSFLNYLALVSMIAIGNGRARKVRESAKEIFIG